MRDEGVLAAIREEATKKLAGAALVGVKVLIDIAHDTEHKDRFRAAKELAAINGFTAEQRIVVEHISPDSKGMIQEIRSMAAQLGLDPKQLISAAGIIEAEFTELPEDTEMDRSRTARMGKLLSIDPEPPVSSDVIEHTRRQGFVGRDCGRSS
jgi:hypothetical protein